MCVAWGVRGCVCVLGVYAFGCTCLHSLEVSGLRVCACVCHAGHGWGAVGRKGRREVLLRRRLLHPAGWGVLLTRWMLTFLFRVCVHVPCSKGSGWGGEG